MNAAAPSSPPLPEPPDEHRLITLRREIAAAEATLRALQIAIDEARSDRSVATAQHERFENERLIVENHLVRQEVDTAHAALEVAVKASQTDALTGVCSRHVLWDRLAHDMALARRLGNRLAVYFLDVDDFKQVNDRYGHTVGDLLLQHVAHVLTATVRASDTVCRMGGDEFVVLASAHRREDAEQVATKIAQALGAPCTLAGQPLSVSASIGFGIFPDDGEAPGVLVRKADEAMYRAKRARRPSH